MKKIEMNIAIIPNKASNMVQKEHEGIAKFQRESLNGYKTRFGLDANEDDLGVQIWYGSEEESYQNGGLPEEFDTLFPASGVHGDGYKWDEYGNRLDILPYMLPAKLFTNKKEGDKVLIFKNQNCEVYGVLNQHENRYARFGNFEDVLNMAIA